MEGNSQERGKWKELTKLPMALVSFFFLMLKSGVLYMLLHLRNLSGGCNLNNNSIEFFVGVA